MRSPVKAIETHYKGCRFRSRTEARWAVLFDHLNVKWSYEEEGFEFQDGTRYLPDFYLPELQIYVEIKGSDEAAVEEGRTSCRRFQGEGGRSILLCDGIPEEGRVYEFYGHSCSNSGAGNALLHGRIDSFERLPGLLLLDDLLPKETLVRDEIDWAPIPPERIVSISSDHWPRTLGFRMAARVARSARFEFGENGGPC